MGRGLEGPAPGEGLAGPEVQSTRGSSPGPLVRLGPGWRSPCARTEAAGDPEEARAAVRSGLCRALRGRRPLRPDPAPPRAAASEAESRQRAGLSQPSGAEGAGEAAGGVLRGRCGCPARTPVGNRPPLHPPGPPTSPTQVPAPEGGRSGRPRDAAGALPRVLDEIEAGVLPAKSLDVQTGTIGVKQLDLRPATVECKSHIWWGWGGRAWQRFLRLRGEWGGWCNPSS